MEVKVLSMEGTDLSKKPSIQDIRKKLGPEKEFRKKQKDLEKKRLIKLDEILQGSDKEIDIYVEEFDAKITVRPITINDYLNVRNIEDSFEQMVEILYIMWSKCDSNVTREKIKQIPMMTLAKILAEFPGLEIRSPLSDQKLEK